MQENYTNPEQAGQGQNPQDLLNASLIFARALGLILKDSEGIVVDTKGDIKLREDVKKVIVFKNEEQVHIYMCEEDIPEGTAVNMKSKEMEPSVAPKNATEMMITTNEDIIESIPTDDEVSDWDVTLMDGLEDESPFFTEEEIS